MPWLVGADPETADQRYPLDAPCLVGRGPYNHVVLDDTRISRQHAKISPEAGGHVVQDLNSANGTYVNEVQVKRQRLQPNDIVRFGPFRFRFETESQPATDKKRSRFVEVLTSVGAEVPASIVDSVPVGDSGTFAIVPENLGQLEDADRKLKVLYTFLQSISTTLDLSELLGRITDHLLDVFPLADAAAVYLRDATGDVRTREVKRRRESSPSLHLPAQFREEVVQRARAVLSAPIGAGASPGPSPHTTPARGVRALMGKRVGASGNSMHAPIMIAGKVEGVLHVRGGNTDGSTPFAQGDLDLLTGLAGLAALALQNARFHQETLRQQRLQQDLRLAEEIQKSFLPRALPSVEGIEFVAEYRPAFSVGGDFYDVFWLNYDRIGVFIGDVAGKGVSAALLMARIASDLRLAATVEPDPGRALEHVNRIVLDRRQHEVFVTGVYFTLDIATREITIANAGHLPPFVRRAAPGDLRRIEAATGTAIGIFDEAEYPSERIALERGDTLVLVTDGVLEAVNGAGEQFGFDRLEASIAHGSSSARELGPRLFRDLRAHVGEAAQSDDITVVLVGVS
jgi:serine phosphatase RsbU (regulator of sigma subunit)/pSer/pThr/pTyr-binding forkhead associated (FHA) protein